MDGDEDKKMKNLTQLIEDGGDESTDFRPNWLCGKCMNSYKSRSYALKYHKCKRRKRQKDPPYMQYSLRCKDKSQRKEPTCCQRSVGRELAALIDRGAIEKKTLKNRQKECIKSYHSSLL